MSSLPVASHLAERLCIAPYDLLGLMLTPADVEPSGPCVMQLDPKAGPNSCRISGFAEKPAQEELAGMAMSDEDLVPFMQQQLREAERREAERGAAERRARQRRGQVLAVEEELEMAGRRAARAAAGRVNLETRVGGARLPRARCQVPALLRVWVLAMALTR